jgi:2,4-dienoyl-CoA reductase-like NADH-dependent reductase (Old Yellow Enzyme family)
MDYRKTLLSPIRIGKLTAENRFFAQPMECSDADSEGNPSDLTYARYERLFMGRFAFIDLEAITITGESRSRLAQLEIMPRNAKAIATFVHRMKEINPRAIFVFQLTHSGELSNPKFSRRVTVKDLPGYEGDLLSEEDVDRMIEEFVLASKIAHDAGADGVDMKLCHGYLGNQILRPYNDRCWKYGGSWENRARFAYELYERIDKAVGDPNFIIGSKVSLWEGFPGGFGSAGPHSPVMDLTEPIDLIKGLEQRGASYFVETIGNPTLTISYVEADRDHTYMTFMHSYFAHVLRKTCKPSTVVVGSHFAPFRDGKTTSLGAMKLSDTALFPYAATCIDDGVMDMVGLGRQSLADPLTPLKLIEGREPEISYCTSCLNCLELMIRQEKIGCATFNKSYARIFADMRKKMGKVEAMHT